MARAGIEIVVAVEDDVLCSVHDAEADNTDLTQAVVGLHRAVLGRDRRQQLVEGRRDVDGPEQLVAVLDPAHVEEDGSHQHEAEQQRVHRRRNGQRQQRIGQDEHEDRAHQRLGDRAAAAAERNAAEHGRGQRLQFHAGADIRCGRADAGREQVGGQRDEDRAQHIGREHRPAHIDAGIVGRAPRAADGQQPPAIAPAREHDVKRQRDDHHQQERGGKAPELADAEELVGRRIRRVHHDIGRDIGENHIENRTVDDQRHQRGEEGAHA